MSDKPSYALPSNDLWNAYQEAQGSADHTARECFNEVVGLELSKILLRLEESEKKDREAWVRVAEAELRTEQWLLQELRRDYSELESRLGEISIKLDEAKKMLGPLGLIAKILDSAQQLCAVETSLRYCMEPIPSMPDGEPVPCARLAGHEGECSNSRVGE